ncbi:MAG: sulfite exporter TauE/SafE family protein [Evtepia sp.]
MEAAQFLLVCPLACLAGFVDAVAGGGGLISLPAYLMAGLPAHVAIGTNKLSSAMGTALSVGKLARRGYVPWKRALVLAVGSLAGSAAGASLALRLDDEAFRRVMLVILPVTAAYLLWGKGVGGDRPPFPPGKTFAIALTVALGVGVYDGFYGPGTGTFLLLLLTAAAHLPLATANGVAKVLNLTTNLTGLSLFWLHGQVLLPLGLAAGACGLVGHWLGTTFFLEMGGRGSNPSCWGCWPCSSSGYWGRVTIRSNC